MQDWKSTISIIIAISIILIALMELQLLCAYNTSSSNNKAIAFNLPEVVSPMKKIDSILLKWQKVIVQKGDTLTKIFARLKIKKRDLLQVTKQYKLLATLHPHQILYFQIKPPNQLIVLKYPLSAATTFIILREGDHFIKKIFRNSVSTILTYKTFTICHSLSQDAKKAGLNAHMLNELQIIFGSVVNFSHNLYQGDCFNFLYKEKYIDGKKCCDGDIIVAAFSHRGKINQAIRYTYPNQHTSYYTPDGYGVESVFLHAPLHYKRISSYFSYHRFDPVLHRTRPHLGVDFAAKIGTPIKSIGEGNVVFIGEDGGYGKTVKIGYNRHYIALYGHMSRFAKIKLHELVHKGQIIGYVGASGWATGPHLHFGFYMDGKPRDWLAMESKIAQSIPYGYKKLFLATAKQLLAELHLHQDTQLAANTNTGNKNLWTQTQ